MSPMNASVTPTILAIDDEEDILGFLTTLFGTRGFRVLTALDGERGFELAQREHPSVVLLDIMMPEVDGHEVCRRLKADPVTSRIPVLMLTAMNRIKDIAQAIDEGADGFMAKPFENRSLVEVVSLMVTPGGQLPEFYIAKKPGAVPLRRIEDVEKGHLVVWLNVTEAGPDSILDDGSILEGAYLLTIFTEASDPRQTSTTALLEVATPEALGDVVNRLAARGGQVVSARVFRDILEVPFSALPRSEHNE
ncbi:response regulator [Candidatus Fermentibacteria bacterium]|nr:response regulator [Candidatus Fermentibacteria bacterium]